MLSLIIRAALRNRRWMRSLGAVVALMAALAILQSVSAATRLTPEQMNQAYLGSADALVSSPSLRCPPERCPTIAEYSRIIEVHGGSDVSAMTVAAGTRIEGHDQGATVQEADWSDDYFPEEYQLVQGRWPAGEHEVVLADDSVFTAQLGDHLNVYGVQNVEVVGLVDSVHLDSSNLVIADTGFTDALFAQIENDGNRYMLPDVSAQMRWSGQVSDEVLRQMAAASAATGETNEQAAEEQLKQGLTQRVAPDRPWGWWLAQTPWLWGLAPVLTVCFCAAALSVLSTQELFGRLRGASHRLGVPVHLLVLSELFARVLLFTGGLALGAVIGWSAALFLRPLAEVGVGRLLSPVAVPMVFYGQLWGIGVAAVAMLTAGAAAAGVLQGSARWLAAAVQVALITVVAAFAVHTLLGLIRPMRSQDDLTAWVVSACVIASVLLGLLLTTALRRASRQGAVEWVLATRHIAVSSGLSAAMATVVMVSVAAPLAIVVALATTYEYSRLEMVDDLPAGQVALGTRMPTGEVPAEIRSDFEEFTGLSRPTEMLLTADASAEELNGLPVVVQSQEEAEAVLGRPLDSRESRAWAAGRILTTPDSDFPPPSTVEMRHVDQQTNELLDTAEIDTEPLTTSDPELGQSWAGIMPARIAVEHDWTLIDAGLLYTDANEQTSALAVQAPESMDFDSRWVAVHDPPEIPELPTTTRIFAGLMGLTLVVVVMGGSRVLAQRLRAYGSALSSLGISAAMLRRVLLIQLALLVLLPMTLAVAVGIGANALGWGAIANGYLISVPWGILGPGLGIAAMAAVLAAAPGLIMLGRDERTRRLGR